jgi:hypothetical protein
MKEYQTRFGAGLISLAEAATAYMRPLLMLESVSLPFKANDMFSVATRRRTGVANLASPPP